MRTLRLLERLAEVDSVHANDGAKAQLQAGTDELIPAAVVDRPGTGGSPLRVWREYPGLTQKAFANTAGVEKSSISQLEAGTKTGAVATLRALAAALDLDLDHLPPWPPA
jgi:DNA-binding XRE family transcriptional regulator